LGEQLVSSLLAHALEKITNWSVQMEDPKLVKKLVGSTNWCAKIKGAHVVSTFMKLSNFSHLPAFLI